MKRTLLLVALASLFAAPRRSPRAGMSGRSTCSASTPTRARAHPSYASYFSSTSGDELAQWGWIYWAGNHGTWLNRDDVAAADSGDINE